MKPILFSTPMVQAILDGRKTQTRRVIKAPVLATAKAPDKISVVGGKFAFRWNGPETVGGFDIKPPYSVGDVLWARETWGIGTRSDPSQGWVDGIEFKADEAFIDEIESLPLYHTDNEALFELYANDERKGWHPSIHMPREAARLFLRVTDVRAERVQDISTSDCEREGITSDIERFNGHMIPHHDWIVGEFSKLWDSINAKRGYGWDTNPWVWVITFESTTV